MANPNIVGVTEIKGVTAGVNITTTYAYTLVQNLASSGKVVKVNTILAANVDGTNAADISVYWQDASNSNATHYLAKTISVPANSTLVVLSKDSAIYLNEGDQIQCVASAANDIDVTISYEEIS